MYTYITNVIVEVDISRMFWFSQARMTDCAAQDMLVSSCDQIWKTQIVRQYYYRFLFALALTLVARICSQINGKQTHSEVEAVLWKSNTKSKQNCSVFERSCPVLGSVCLTRIHFERQCSQAVSSCLKLSHQFEVPSMPAETDKDGMLRCAVSLDMDPVVKLDHRTDFSMGFNMIQCYFLCCCWTHDLAGSVSSMPCLN